MFWRKEVGYFFFSLRGFPCHRICLADLWHTRGANKVLLLHYLGYVSPINPICLQFTLNGLVETKGSKVRMGMWNTFRAGTVVVGFNV